MTPIELVLSKLSGVKRNGKGWIACCPAHDDRRASLSVSEGDDGRALLHCHAGCDVPSIVSALDLKMSSLFPGTTSPNGEVTATYQYLDANGQLVHEVVRKGGKRFLQRRPDGDGGWIWNLNGIQRVLYRLPELLAADPGALVFIVEGEKDVDRLRALGRVATCNPGGAGKWKHVDDTPLHGLNVCILPDHDAPGRAHAADIAARLHGKAASITVIELPNLPEKGDVADWIEAGGTVDDLIDLIDRAEEWTPPPESPSAAAHERRQPQSDSFPVYRGGSSPESNTDPFSDPVPISQLGDDEPVEWILEGLIAHGYSTLFSALWKAGKTTFLSALCSETADGGTVGLRVNRARILIVTEEPKALWRRRREDHSIGDHVEIWCRPVLGKPTPAVWVSLVGKIARLVRERSYDLVVIDTITRFAPWRDENDSAKAMDALAHLEQITEAGAGLVLVHHSKKGDAKEGQSARGSGAIAGWVDIIVELRRHDPQRRDDRRRVLTNYSRLSETPDEIVIALDQDGRYTLVGTKADANTKDREEAILNILTEEGRTTEDIRREWPDDGVPKPGTRTIRGDLARLHSEGRVNRTGEGKRGSPHLYSILASSTPYKPESNTATSTPGREVAR